MSTSHRLNKPKSMGETRANNGSESLQEFLMSNLPRGKTKQLAYLADALHEAGARYDRYSARKEEWSGYARRSGELRRIAKRSDELALCLSQLDILSRDDLAKRIGQKEIEALVGSLGLLNKKASDLAKEAQGSGRPRDLAEERWILELADIYENAFGQAASVWGPGGGVRRPSKFCRLLELSRPISFAQYGKLSPRQIGRVLGRKNAK
jgi:hypothetical protein